MRRQQAQEENEARELGLLYAHPGQQQSHTQQSHQQSDGGGLQTSAYHSGIPSPPNDQDGGQRVQFSGSESGEFYFVTIILHFLFNLLFLFIQYSIIRTYNQRLLHVGIKKSKSFYFLSDVETHHHRIRSNRIGSTYSPDRHDNDSPGKLNVLNFLFYVL